MGIYERVLERQNESEKPDKTMTKKFIISNSGHPIIDARINGVIARFIIDTGASNSCIDERQHDAFGLTAYLSPNGLIGAGGNSEGSRVCETANFSIRSYKQMVQFVMIDLFDINMALQRYGIKPVHGIIGSDVIVEGSAVIDYKNKTITLINKL